MVIADASERTLATVLSFTIVIPVLFVTTVAGKHIIMLYHDKTQTTLN